MRSPALVATAVLAAAGGAAAGNFTTTTFIYSAAWALDPVDATLFHVVAQAATTGWVGFGVATAPNMYPADAVVGWMGSNNVGVLSDSYNRAYSQPALDTALGGTDDLRNISVTRETNSKGKVFTTIAYSRALNTGDTYDVVISDRNIYLLWAYGAAGSVNEATCTYARHFDRDFVPTNFLPVGGERATRDDLLVRLEEWRERAATGSDLHDDDDAAESLSVWRNTTIPVCQLP